MAPPETELQILRNVAVAARLTGVSVYLSVYPPGSRSTPLTPEAREQFAAYVTVLAQQLPSVKDVIVGNEPNLNRFWMPQFNPDGSDAAAPAYLALLARSYDALKAVDPEIRVWGGALAPRGIDRPTAPATPIRRSRSCATWAPPTGRAAGPSRSWTASRSTRTPTRPASRPTRRTRSRRRSASPTTTAS